MEYLMVALATFVGGHFILASLPVRQAVIGFIGENGFRLFFSVFALGTLAWTIYAYTQAPYREIWAMTPALRLVPIVLMPFACILMVAGSSTRNVTAVGGEALAAEGVPTAGILTITRHPLMWGITLWALAHIAPNGDAAGLLMFGGFIVLGFGGMAHIDHRRQATLGAAWGPVALTTSVTPFVAAIQGRTSVDWKGIGLARPIAGLVLYVVFVFGHEWVIGVSPMGG